MRLQQLSHSKMNQKEFFKTYNVNPKEFETTTLKWTDLEKIQAHYNSQVSKLETSAVYIFNTLMKMKDVHSVRYRIKNAEHVIEKIIRKRISEPERIISIDRRLN